MSDYINEFNSTYEANVSCYNCGKTSTIQVTKGVSIDIATCPNCGCSSLTRSNRKNFEHIM